MREVPVTHRAQTLAERLHFNTYGGNPVCCAGGRAVLRAVDEDGLQANCAEVLRRCALLLPCPHVASDCRNARVVKGCLHSLPIL